MQANIIEQFVPLIDPGVIVIYYRFFFAANIKGRLVVEKEPYVKNFQYIFLFLYCILGYKTWITLEELQMTLILPYI